MELARVLDKRRAKKAIKGDEEGDTSAAVELTKAETALPGTEKAKRTYKQRQAVDREGMKEKGMESVLGSVFG